MRRGLYIAVEGIDGAGKTTHAKLLTRKLSREGFKAILVHEPTDSEVGRIIRKALKNKTLPEEAMALLFAADRLILREVLNDAFKKNYVVVSDRSVLSSLAYQSAATKNRKWVEEVNRYAAKPDVVVFIDISPEKALRRLGHSLQRYERAAFLRSVRREYLRQLRRLGKVVVVKGDQPIPDVSRKIYEGLSPYLRGFPQLPS
ncbi:MAG: dTMP kinase [Candidatus Caldarchaeum sp.]|nr:dTMP kinase [Candidatus Caldarchaeum sp.]